jgi:hypothetical protein
LVKEFLELQEFLERQATLLLEEDKVVVGLVVLEEQFLQQEVFTVVAVLLPTIPLLFCQEQGPRELLG